MQISETSQPGRECTAIPNCSLMQARGFVGRLQEGGSRQRRDESVMFAAEISSLPWSLCCVDLFAFANPGYPLTFPNSIPRGRPSLEDRL